jgi:hypothetical protein
MFVAGTDSRHLPALGLTSLKSVMVPTTLFRNNKRLLEQFRNSACGDTSLGDVAQCA